MQSAAIAVLAPAGVAPVTVAEWLSAWGESDKGHCTWTLQFSAVHLVRCSRKTGSTLPFLRQAPGAGCACARLLRTPCSRSSVGSLIHSGTASPRVQLHGCMIPPSCSSIHTPPPSIHACACLSRLGQPACQLIYWPNNSNQRGTIKVEGGGTSPTLHLDPPPQAFPVTRGLPISFNLHPYPWKWYPT
jgi:hypothetical protein